MQRGWLTKVTQCVMVGGLIAATIAWAPQQLNRYLASFWLEEAHQALLTSLVQARNFARDNAVNIAVCAANETHQCVDIASHDVVAWRVYPVPTTAQGLTPDALAVTQTISFNRYHHNLVGLRMMGELTDAGLGFDQGGYSLQPQVLALEITEAKLAAHKKYTVVIEPSGALQTIASAPLQAAFDVALAQNGQVPISPYAAQEL